MAITLPHIFKAKETAASAAVNENFATLIEAIENVSAASAAADVYQAGVLVLTDWKPATFTINEGTGVLELTTFGGSAWLPGPSGALVRTFTTNATFSGVKPPVLPAENGWRPMGVELTASGNSAVVSLVSGAEKASEAEAIASPPATTAGKMRVRDFQIGKEAGKFLLRAQRDRRPWARGASGLITRTAGNITAGGAGAVQYVDATGLAMRIECSGLPLILELHGYISQTLETIGGGFEAAALGVGFRMDGATIGETSDGQLRIVGMQVSEAAGAKPFVKGALDIAYSFVPAAGSHLFQPTYKKVNGATTIQSTAANPLTFVVREDVRPSANNGTV